ncbi:pyridoxal-dependent decarboxylase, exosortase A system-associated [Pseudoalteromonas sp. MMG012]|uniref:pyridoxal-dependent decarboxylase, exosortase A system-associated n=1 Tax=Pseudoalteromonas sp. MMG012 TaxID=2822686 RepID=UPI001B39F62D|nr:pyridoxal-dependent decarboxylase, exosortase A system-associated [Pseudoalteromonas sp. MMG012]MBQ4852441.1 pyridoxal-dependent decarboxylase, exosortase A system-associated [Pseudoalteromonas sp. MMG012]
MAGLSRVHHVVENNQLQVAGLAIEDAIKIAGGTPCYIYDGQQVVNNIKNLKRRLPSKVKLHYAIKANPFPSLITRMATVIDGFDVASHQEMLLALASGLKSHAVSIAGPGKSDTDLSAAICAGVTINVESKFELTRLHALSETLKKRAKVALRINPAFELKQSGMKMSGGAKQFGIDEEQVLGVLDYINSDYIDFKGFHIFSGSQNLSEAATIECHNQTFELISRLLNDTPFTASHINIGGGFGVAYFEHESPLNLAPIIDNLQALLTIYAAVLKGVDIHLELGRYLVADAGVYLTRVVDKKVSRGTTFLVVDGGMHHHLANSGNLGQVIRKNYPVCVANRYQHNNQEQVDIVGPLCTPLDIVAAKVHLPTCQPNDIIAVMQSGAYGASASPQSFLSQPILREVLL